MNKIISLKLIVLFGLSFLHMGFVTSHTGNNTLLDTIAFEENVSYVETPSLTVNTTDACRTIVRKNEKEGIKDIQDLLKQSTLEEKWIYCPEKELWIEMGIHSKKIDEQGRVGFQVFSRMKEFKPIFISEKRLVDYHFHPQIQSLGDNRAELFLQEANLENNDKNLNWAKENYFYPVQRIFSAIPVRDDLFQLIISSCVFYKIHPDGDFCHKVLSPYGITTCYIKKDKKEAIQHFTIEQAEVLTDELSSHIDGYIAHKLTLKHNNIKDPETGIKIIRQTVRRLNYLDIVQLEFSPHDEYKSF